MTICGEVDPASGAVCTVAPHSGRTHTDLSVPECMIQWGPAPGLVHRDESSMCWARAFHAAGAWPETPCDRRAVSGGLCEKHAQAFGVVA